eukprot:CFRG7284T1
MSPTKLFEPLQVGDILIKNRMVMAPLTRCRADPETRVPTEMMVQYYRERAAFGMILTEATSINAMGVGYPATPGIWSDEQVEGWRKIVDAVHEEGGTIFLQLWHVGRMSHTTFLDGKTPVSSSEETYDENVALIRPEVKYQKPRALTLEEIEQTIEDYRLGAVNAKKAGFDGVEVHAANGYLPEQFLLDGTNKRTDRYGGSLENRMRFTLEVLDACISVYGAGRVGIHLSPRHEQILHCETPDEDVMRSVAEEVEKRHIAFIFVREHWNTEPIGPNAIRKAFNGVVIVNEGFDMEAGEKAIESGKTDAVSYGRLAIANPDLIERFRSDAEFNVLDYTTMLGFNLTQKGEVRTTVVQTMNQTRGITGELYALYTGDDIHFHMGALTN